MEIAKKRREVKDKREKGRYIHLHAEFQRIARIRKPSSAISAKKWRETIEWEDERSPQENQRHQGKLSCRDGLNKGQKWSAHNRSRRY